MGTRRNIARLVLGSGLLLWGCQGGQSGNEGPGTGFDPEGPMVTGVANCPCTWLRESPRAVRAQVVASDSCGATVRVTETLLGPAQVDEELSGPTLVDCSAPEQPVVGSDVLAIDTGAGLMVVPWGEHIPLPATPGLARSEVGVLLDRDACQAFFDEHTPERDQEVDLPELEPGDEAGIGSDGGLIQLEPDEVEGPIFDAEGDEGDGGVVPVPECAPEHMVAPP